MIRTDRMLFSVLLLAVFSLQTALSAQENSSRGFYVGGAVGLSNYKVDDFDDDVNIPDDSIKFEETTFAYKAHLGKRFNRDLGLELALSDYGEANDDLGTGISGDDLKIDEWGASLNVVGFLPVGNHYLPELEQVELFGKVGPAWVNQSVSLDATDSMGDPVDVSEDDSGFGVGAGVGANLYVTKQLAIRGEVESIFAHPTDLDDDMKTERIFGFLGLQYNFHDLPRTVSRR